MTTGQDSGYTSGTARFVWENRKAVWTVVIVFCVLGAYFSGHLPVAIFPQLTVPRIVIAADAGDLPIETTLATVTRPIESAVNSLPGVSKVDSTTSRGSADFDVTFSEGSDMPVALQRVQSAIADIRGALPTDTDVTAELINPSIFPIMGLNLTSNVYDTTTLRSLARYTIRPQLARLPGIAQIRITGGDSPEYLVSVRLPSLAARGLTLNDVESALANANGIASVGHFDQSYQRYEILVSGMLRDDNDIRNVTIATKNLVPLTVADVATVTRTFAPRSVLASGDGRPAVTINVIKQANANTVDVADEVHAALPRILRGLPAGIDSSMFYDQSEIVRQSEASVVEAIVVGGVLALLVLMMFLGNLRAASIVLLLLPITLLITFSLMKALGQTLNIMTLGALAIAMGLVIDDGIVVVENMFHELESGKSKRHAISAGLKAIGPAMIGSSLTTMLAFLPLTFLSGVTGQFFAPLALVMIATLFVSLALALILTPLLADLLLPASRRRPHNLTPFDRFANRYGNVLSWCVRRRSVVLLTLVPLAVCSYLLYTHLETGFFPVFDEGAFVIDYLMPAGASLAETDRVASEVEGELAKTPEVAGWSRLTGAQSGSGLELTEQNQGDILVRLKNNRVRTADEVMNGLRDQIGARQPVLQVDFAQILQDGIGDIAGSPSPIEVKIYGDDTATLSSLADKTEDILQEPKGVVDAESQVIDSGPEVMVRVDPERASRYGLTTDAITADATSALSGTIATTVQSGEESIPVRVKAQLSSDLLTPQSLTGLPIAAPTLANGQTVPLGAAATVSVQPGTPQITRENSLQLVSIDAGLEGRDLGSAMREVQDRMKRELALPPGYRVEYGGLYASQQQSFTQLATVLLLAVLLVATLLLVQFRSVRQAVSLLAAAVLSLFGVLLGLFITRTPLNISSYTGAIMIVGIVTENGIVLFDFFNHLRRERPDLPAAELMVLAGRNRLRPILMTTLGAILALFPLALGLGAGAAMQKPLAIAVIGGLSVSTFFTLIVAPVLYLSMFPGSKRTHKHRESRPDGEPKAIQPMAEPTMYP